MGAVNPPRIQIIRWVGHGVDIRTRLADDADPLFYAADIEVALGLLDADGAAAIEDSRHAKSLGLRLCGEVRTASPAYARNGWVAPLYEIDTVIRVARQNPTRAAAEFLPWFHELVETLDREPLLDEEPRPEPEAAADDGATYTIAEAAHILTGDPALRSYGRDPLFQAMRRMLGWIDRENGTWVPSSVPLASGWLTRYRIREETRRVDPARVTYPQIRITASGLTELHRILGGVADLTLDPVDEPTLLEGL